MPKIAINGILKTFTLRVPRKQTNNRRKALNRKTMPTVIEAPQNDFVPHPAGTFIAVLRDTFFRDRPNPWKGQLRDDGSTDDRDTIREIVFEFLTEHEVQVGDKMLPGFVSYTATPSLAENANLRKFLKSWFPQLKDEDLKRFDADKLIGRGAYLTVAHNVSKKNGKTYANVVGAMQPPKGSTLPAIPADFIRHEDRVPTETATEPPAPAKAPEPDDDLPF